MALGGRVNQSFIEVPAGYRESIINVNYILIFQAGLLASEVFFKQQPAEDKLEALRMEHFYFPLGLWFFGILLSAIFLLAEIIIHRIRKPQTEVAMLRLEEPSVTQCTPESEHLGEMVLNKGRAEAENIDVSENIDDTKVKV